MRAKISHEQVTVPAMDGRMVTLSPGDNWPLPFRGSRYTVKTVDQKPQLCWTWTDIVYTSSNGISGLIDAMRDHKKDTKGSIRITPHSEIITKRKEGNKWRPVYLGKLQGVLDFPGFDLDPSNLTTGHLWPGLQFKHGEEFSVWRRHGNKDFLYWSFRGMYFRTIQRYPLLCGKLREIRPRCGRLYVTETGHIWMNLPIEQVSQLWNNAISQKLTKDRKALQQNDTLLQATYDRLQATKTYPIYLGTISDFDIGTPPRTHFTSKVTNLLGAGGEDYDDGDQYRSKYWKRMKWKR